MSKLRAQVTVEKPPYRPLGRYVCDWRITECHLFDTLPEALEFAKNWQRDCNVGWLAPVLSAGRNRKPTLAEARLQIATSITTEHYIDHRKI